MTERKLHENDILSVIWQNVVISIVTQTGYFHQQHGSHTLWFTTILPWKCCCCCVAWCCGWSWTLWGWCWGTITQMWQCCWCSGSCCHITWRRLVCNCTHSSCYLQLLSSFLWYTWDFTNLRRSSSLAVAVRGEPDEVVRGGCCGDWRDVAPVCVRASTTSSWSSQTWVRPAGSFSVLQLTRLYRFCTFLIKLM